MQCNKCGSSFNDGVQCSACKNQFDFGCANITEAGFRKLGSDRRAQWRCPQCKISGSVSPAVADPTLTSILDEIRDMKTQLACLPLLVEEVKSFRSELASLKSSCEFNGARIDEHDIRLTTMESSVTNILQLEEALKLTQTELTELKQQRATDDQWARMSNVEVKGVPLKSGENLFSITDALGKAVGCDIAKPQINYIARVPTQNSKEKSIVIGFLNRYVKEEFVAAARAKKSITASDIGFSGNPQRIFVNDHLTPNYKMLLTKTKSLAKDKGYSYVWVKYCKIHVRKNDTSHVLVISRESDLNKMV